MKQKNRYFKRTRKKKSTRVNVLFGVILAGLAAVVIWIGANDWNADKVLVQLGIRSAETGESEQKTPQDGELVETSSQEGGSADRMDGASTEHKNEPASKTTNGYIEGQELPKEPKYVNGILIANKRYPLPKDFAPGEDPAAREAFEKMAAEAKLFGFHLHAFSTYRSYEYQTTLYKRYVDRDGEDEADRYSARPGYSEHQTGLAFDIGEVNYEQHWASSSFGETEAGKWLAANAHRYGFILRYPKGKENVTGYMHESWHFRYVGEQAAEEIFKRNITLEEYLGLN